MEISANGWLVNFMEEDIPTMSAAEILHRLVALREIENAPHFMYNLPLKGEGREWIVHRDPEAPNGYTICHINWLMEELRRRGHYGGERA